MNLEPLQYHSFSVWGLLGSSVGLHEKILQVLRRVRVEIFLIHCILFSAGILVVDHGIDGIRISALLRSFN